MLSSHLRRHARANVVQRLISLSAKAAATSTTIPGDANKPFDKILIANRGEISSRVMRTCAAHGIESVAIYSLYDSQAPYVKEADHTICIGKSYLDADRVLKAIEESGAQACMPGYGFFSENSKFAASLPPGVKWLGPSPEAIDQMGCKIRSKVLALQAGVNIVPGFEGELQSLDHALTVANDIGYPVLIKAASGGGGKGMRICRSDQDVRDSYPLAKSEALKFFNDDRLLLEKYVDNPHHIEFQLLSGPSKKNPGELDIVVFCERECSIQRRHQKILEESPSPLLKEETRLKMVEQVKKLVRQVGYTSAGTVEFLVDEEQNFYFLEMNTRLQVEHPVTESVSVGNLDLVKGMLWVGAGWGVPEEYLEILGDKPYYPHHGHAIEARVYAEDPLRGFLPSTGPLVPYQEPISVRTADRILRVDSGVAEGHIVTPHYDPMLSKVIAWSAEGRQASLDQLHLALQEYVIGGTIRHNTKLVMDVIAHPAFQAGKTPTSFLPTHYPDGFSGVELSKEDKQDVAVCMVVLENDTRPVVIARLGGMFGEALKVERLNDVSFMVSTMGDEDDDVRIINLDEPPTYKKSDLLARVSLNGGDVKTIQTLSSSTTGEIQIEMKGASIEMLLQSPREYELSKHMHEPLVVDTSDMVLSPMPGTLISIAVQPGDSVQIGQELCVLEAMKMQNIIRSPRTGVIATCRVPVGATLAADQVILDFEVEQDPSPTEEKKMAA
ncbi:CoA carboxylase [Fragilaria crotonensis]|nr:CoA carboxylase [Fragilaria crotonensis]